MFVNLATRKVSPKSVLFTTSSSSSALMSLSRLNPHHQSHLLAKLKFWVVQQRQYNLPPTCHVSCVTCHLSRVTCHIVSFIFGTKSGSQSAVGLLSMGPTRLVFVLFCSPQSYCDGPFQFIKIKASYSTVSAESELSETLPIYSYSSNKHLCLHLDGQIYWVPPASQYD